MKKQKCALNIYRYFFTSVTGRRTREQGVCRAADALQSAEREYELLDTRVSIKHNRTGYTHINAHTCFLK